MKGDMDKMGLFRKIFNLIGKKSEIDKIENLDWLYFER